MKIIGIITTKNRYEFYEKALLSVVSQTRKPEMIIVVSDSDEDLKNKERELAEKCSAVFLADKYTHNYAGSLNTAIHFILEKDLFEEHDYDQTYVAFLDDDDLWEKEYIAECERALNGEDFVVSGLIYGNEAGQERLSIPHKLTMESFLCGNPHLQGSNTFVKLSTLLKAGLFDESMSSTTDRDIFTRIMLLNPTYAVIDRHLVKIDAFNSRSRITNRKETKVDGLRKFLYKYGAYMSQDVKEAFFTRAEKLFGIKKEELLYGNKKMAMPEVRYTRERYCGELVIGFIATDYLLGARLLEEITALKRKNTRIVILINFLQSKEVYSEILQNSGYTYEFIERDDILNEIRGGAFNQFVTEENFSKPIIKDVAVARVVLQKYLYKHTTDKEVVWVLDEDMRLKELMFDGEEYKEEPLDIDAVIGEYIGKYDAVVGNYTLDPPLPLLSTLRTSLLDCFYNKKGIYGKCFPRSFKDYYYDLSDETTDMLELPVKCAAKYTADDVFCGKALSRKLFLQDAKIKEVTGRGGNTIVFNRALLTIPNWSIRIGDKIGRRSDYFWVWYAQNKGYKIVNAPFATLHDRAATRFDYEKEKEKLLVDLMGYAFTRAVAKVGIGAKGEEFCFWYDRYFSARLTKVIANFYRIQGLLSMLNESKYIDYFSQRAIGAYIKEVENYSERGQVFCAYEDFCKKLHIQSQTEGDERIRKELEKYFHIPANSLRYLGNGGEGVVFTDDEHVYKYFFKSSKNLAFLRQIAPTFAKCKHLYPQEFYEVGGKTVLRYKYERSKPYKGGHTADFVDLLRFAEENGFVFDNYKQSNFIVVQGQVKLIDYGKSFLPISAEGKEKSITRVYEMLRYPFLNEEGYKQLIYRSYRDTAKYIDDGKEMLRQLVECKYKEDLHDEVVKDLILRENPAKVLDYGAGKCKIANALANRCDISVYDLDTETLNARADSRVRKIFVRDDLKKEEYDLAACNLVLCCIPNNVAQNVICDINAVLKDGGKAVISICNPLFNTAGQTQLRKNGLTGDYRHSTMFYKHLTVGTAVRKEYHRPIEYYENLLSRNGLEIEQAVEGGGVNAETLMPISEHIIFVCKKIAKARCYEDCSLLIKTNPMEWQRIYKNICHIVNSLERFGRFENRIVVADMTEAESRARRYACDDEEKLKRALLLAKENGLIDEIFFIYDDSDMKKLYRKYFDKESEQGHSVNGQGIYASISAFDKIHTKYVFQTDSDIMYYIKSDALGAGIKALKDGAVTVALSVARSCDGDPQYGNRTEVRSCLIDLEKLKARLPLPNVIEDGMLSLPWHRSLDLVLQKKESVRFANAEAWFIHPENHKKKEKNLLSIVQEQVEKGRFFYGQNGKVNLEGTRGDWVEKTYADVVLYIRGYNTPCEKLKRLFDSIKKQTYQNFEIVYIDDASTNESADYARLIIRKDPYFAAKVKACFNDENVGELENFVFAMQNMVLNKNAIVINVDNDDYLVNEHAIEIITKRFAQGVEITCGNCIRWDKPLKNYRVYSFDRVWERGGDNIWLHPKCFRRYLFDGIDIEEDLKIDGKYVDVNTDFAFMLPMVQRAKKCGFIQEVLYYFEPSSQNREGAGKYGEEEKHRVKKILLEKAKMREKNLSKLKDKEEK